MQGRTAQYKTGPHNVGPDDREEDQIASTQPCTNIGPDCAIYDRTTQSRTRPQRRGPDRTNPPQDHPM